MSGLGEQIRYAEYAHMNQNIQLKIDHGLSNPKAFGKPSMGLSSSKASMTQHEYKYSVDWQSFYDAIFKEYQIMIKELKEDDIITGEIDEFGEQGYPSLEVLATMPSLFSEMISVYISNEYFDYYHNPQTENIVYWIDGFNTVECRDNRVIFRGVCYKQ